MKKFTVFALSVALTLPALAPFSQVAQASSFPDVSDQSTYREAIDYLKAEGIVHGNPDGKFKPSDRIVKAAFTKILIEALYSDEEINKCTTSDFFDVSTTEWYAKYVCMAKKHGIVNGNPDGSFGPADYINFATASKILAEAQDLSGVDLPEGEQWYTKYVKALEQENAIPGSISDFAQEITRDQMAEMTYRIEAKRKDKVSSTYDEIKNPFPSIASCVALKDKLDEYRYDQPIYYYGPGEPMPIEEDMTEESAPVPSVPSSGGGLGEDKSSNDYSETNVQVDGVDEADIVKNDGKYIYMIKGDTVRIINAYPADQMKEVANIQFDAEGFHPQELFVTENKLVAIGQDYNYYHYLDSKIGIMPPIYNQDQTKVFVYDITDRTAPKQLRKVAFDGYYSNSRRIDDQVYLILNASPNYWNLEKVDSGEDFVPTLKDGDKTVEKMVDCTDIRYFPGHKVPQYLITASIDLDSPQSAIDRNVFLGSSDNVYASKTNLFVASTYADYDRFTDWDWKTDKTKSHLYNFKLEDGQINFVARGDVMGRILNQFSMDQYKDHFRIATTTGNAWWGEENNLKNHVYVLDKNMKQVGSLTDLAPGEQIHSARFMGGRLYMVTFQQVDPLFVIDMTSPTAPKVLGELKIPGFSEYLHPYDENHILGFGQETALVKDNVRIDGFKMSMFDVTDVNHPKQQFVEVIGDAGTYSDVLYNHKALLFNKEKGLIAFPIQIQELVKPSELQCNTYTLSTCPASCIQACIPGEDDQCADVAGSCVAPTYEQYQTTFSGALVYNVDLENGFTERGRITHLTAEDMEKMGSYWYDYNKVIQRILYIGEYLYTVAQGGVKASSLEDVKEVNMVKLEGDEEPAKPVPMPMIEE